MGLELANLTLNQGRLHVPIHTKRDKTRQVQLTEFPNILLERYPILKESSLSFITLHFNLMEKRGMSSAIINLYCMLPNKKIICFYFH